MKQSDVWNDAWDAEVANYVREKLIAARHAAGLTQTEVAHAAGLHLQAVYAVEAGIRTPNFLTMARIAHAIRPHFPPRPAASVREPKPIPRRKAKAKSKR